MNSKEILIFRTSTKRRDMERIEIIFAQYPQIHAWNVDFEDWENVLRIESRGIAAARIVELLRTLNIIASELE